MTITLAWWMLFPAVLVLLGFVLLWLGEQETGMLGGLFHGLAAVALFAIAAAFLIGRWLA